MQSRLPSTPKRVTSRPRGPVARKAPDGPNDGSPANSSGSAVTVSSATLTYDMADNADAGAPAPANCMKIPSSLAGVAMAIRSSPPRMISRSERIWPVSGSSTYTRMPTSSPDRQRDTVTTQLRVSASRGGYSHRSSGTGTVHIRVPVRVS